MLIFAIKLKMDCYQYSYTMNCTDWLHAYVIKNKTEGGLILNMKCQVWCSDVSMNVYCSNHYPVAAFRITSQTSPEKFRPNSTNLVVTTNGSFGDAGFGLFAYLSKGPQ